VIGYQIKPEPDTRELTPRQVNVLQALANGESMKAFAEINGLSYSSVKNTVSFAMDALGADTKEQAVAMALRRGIIT
jgi:DNA-binding NarL/FixJ family response regulator